MFRTSEGPYVLVRRVLGRQIQAAMDHKHTPWVIRAAEPASHVLIEHPDTARILTSHTHEIWRTLFRALEGPYVLAEREMNTIVIDYDEALPCFT